MSPQLQHQRGVAVITALLLTTLAITIVASLFWQQQVQVRSIENQRMQLQKKWVLRGAIDWARLILREDGRVAGRVDHLGEPWAVRLADTRLDQYVENGREDADASDATLSGQIVDAQSMFNLTNLASNGVVDPREVDAFGRLLLSLHIDTQLADSAASMIASSQIKVKKSTDGTSGVTPAGTTSPATPEKDGGSKSTAESSATEVQFPGFVQVDDLLAVSGFTPEIVATLRKFVTVLPRRTPININTTSAEVLAARIDGVSAGDAAAMIATRDRAYFFDIAHFKQQFSDKTGSVVDQDLSVATNFFLVNGKVKMNRSALDVSALIERNGNVTSVLWIREN
ncbi:MAG: type II secretion system minor pseudopilin GspK [Burkholderiales bacterium]|nr:type II secretion system minor pseudopilin GspK [Burkholderiales bacterium]